MKITQIILNKKQKNYPYITKNLKYKKITAKKEILKRNNKNQKNKFQIQKQNKNYNKSQQIIL